ncbi:hypothetical protein JW992_04695 [candidate division KSB1 bacterium]|nr:hypothetical protein [candidate division KSB1 bacterium]
MTAVPLPKNLDRIITHDDFDGIVCAAIVSQEMNLSSILFAGPTTISDSRLSITGQDVVCDLPCPLEVGAWFDHHPINFEDLLYRQIDPQVIPGRFQASDSCARVVHDFFSEPPQFAGLVQEADIIDSFNYVDLNDWRKETPGKIIDCTLKLNLDPPQTRRGFMRQLVQDLKKMSYKDVARLPAIQEKYRLYQQEEERMLEIVEQYTRFLPQDTEQSLAIIDLTPLKRQTKIIKNLAYLLYPNIMAVAEVKNRFQHNVKTNDLAISVSLSLRMNRQRHRKDLGAIMRDLNIGGGHSGAAAGAVYCQTKADMLKTKEETLGEILDRFNNQ